MLLLGLILYYAFRPAPTGTSDPEAKLRLERILEIYKGALVKYPKGVPDEKALKDYIAKMSKEERDGLKITDDVDASLLTSPRDGQKYEIRYKVVFFSGGEARAIAWEQTGKGGKRFVLVAGPDQVMEMEEDELNEMKKK